ncbi:hypothetical protein CAI21_16615 [Alkalilimnicola ehrlichii]|nr:hypothetical protein CAI21_16615 [Alkalilimnicola ehrlichii]
MRDVMLKGISMPYRMSPQQYESVLTLSGADRSAHFVGKVVDWQQLWGVKNDEGWLVPITPDDWEYFPVWPHPEYAQKSQMRISLAIMRLKSLWKSSCPIGCQHSSATGSRSGCFQIRSGFSG